MNELKPKKAGDLCPRTFTLCDVIGVPQSLSADDRPLVLQCVRDLLARDRWRTFAGKRRMKPLFRGP